MSIISHGQLFDSYQCQHIGVTGLRCSMRFTDKADIALHNERHKKTDDVCRATDAQKATWKGVGEPRRKKLKPLRGAHTEEMAKKNLERYQARKKAAG
jgi:hypothetical protein